MSDMSQLYKAYAAVHNKDIKTELTESKDEISWMNLNSLMSSDLIEITEEIVESMFESGFDVKDTKAVIAHIFESAQSGFVTEVRQNKIERLQEAFYKTFQKVTEKSPKIAVESFINYRNQKPLVEKWDNRVSHEFDNSKTHKSLVAEDRKRVLDGLMDMVLRGMDEVFDEGKKLAAPDHDPVGQEDKDIDNDGDHDKTDKYLLNRRKVIGKAMGKKMKKVEKVEEVYKGKHGQSDKEYADSRSPGGKMVSGDSKMSGAEYTHGRRVKAANPGMQPDVGGKTKPMSQGRMDRGTRADIEYRKANLKKEELELDQMIESLVERGHTEQEAYALVAQFTLDEDSRRMSNKQHTKRVKANIKSFGSNYTPPSNYDPDANRGQGEVVTRKQMEKKRRKALRQEDYVNEAQAARNNPEKYEREARKTETSGQKAERRVRDRLKTMDPKRAEAMKKQMRAVGLDV